MSSGPDEGNDLGKGRVLGDFRLIRQIGKGGMGIVWEAEQLSLRRLVALKVLSPALSLSASHVARFQREATAGGRLSHPGIVAVYEIGEVEGLHYIAQELVPGAYTLAEFLDEARGRVVLPDGYYRAVAELFAGVAEALTAAHAAGVIHRDVKPANILLTSDERPKVADFGLASINDDLVMSRVGELAGTPYYMSPEQAMSKRIGLDHRTDIFSLGATLYEALALQRPFEGDTSQQVLEKIVLYDPPEPHRFRSKVPRDLSVICVKSMEKRREHRYATMADLAADLRRFLSNEPILAQPPSVPSRIIKWSRRHPAVSAGAVSTFTGMAVILWLFVGIQERNSALQQTNEYLERARNDALAQKGRADEAARTARVESATAQETVTFLMGLFRSPDPVRAQGDEPTAKEILDDGIDRIRSELRDQPEVRGRLLYVMGAVHQSLGNYDKAKDLLLEAFDTQEVLYGVNHPDSLYTVMLLAALAGQQNDHAEARRLYQKAWMGWTSLGPVYHREQIATSLSLAFEEFRSGQPGGLRDSIAEASYRLERLSESSDDSDLTASGSRFDVYLPFVRVMLTREEARHLVDELTVVDGKFHLDLSDASLRKTNELLEQHALEHGSKNPLTLALKCNLYTLMSIVGVDANEHQLFDAVLSGMREILGASHPETLLCMENLVRHEWAMRRLNTALPLARELVSLTGTSDPRSGPRASLLAEIEAGL